MFLIPIGVGHSSIPFTFSSSILIPLDPITTSRKPTSFTFHLHFSGFIYKSFSFNLFIISATISLYPFSISVSTIILSMKAATLPILIKSLSNSFIIAQKVTGEFVSPKNMTVGSNDPLGIVKAIFHLSPSFIHTLLQLYLKSIFVNTFFVPIFFTTSDIKGKG